MPSDQIQPGHNLGRFCDAQEGIYTQVLQELVAGEKRGHWIWFIFPQVACLGYSSTSQHYAIGDIDEARAYLDDPVLGTRLLQCTAAVLAVEGYGAEDIFGGVDAMKFKSSMTLFAAVADPQSVFQQALDQYFDGEPDYLTLDIIDLDPGG